MKAIKAACIVVVFVAAAGFPGCGGTVSVSAGPEVVLITTSDGVDVCVSIYPVPAARPPGLLLLHRYGADSQVWDTFARAAQREGLMVAALDLRGHGRSRNQRGHRLDYRGLADFAWASALNEVRAAKSALIQAGADPANVAVGGEGLGANLALRAARFDPDFQAIVALSPCIEERGIAAEPEIRAMRERPVLLVASDGDSYAAASAAALKQIAPGFCELRTYPGGAHGADILAAAPGAVSMILGWLEAVIPEQTKPKS